MPITYARPSQASSPFFDDVLPHLGPPTRSVSSASAAVKQMSSPLLKFLDLAALSAALFLTVVNFFLRAGEGGFASFLRLRISMRNLCIELALLLVWRIVFWAVGLYHVNLNRRMKTLLWKVPLAVLLCGVVLLPVLLLRDSDREMAQSFVVFWVMGTALMLMLRGALSNYEEHVRPLFRRPRTALICGTGLRARILASELPGHREFKYHLSGFIDSDPQIECNRLAPVLGSVDELERILMREPIDEVIIALPLKSRFADIEQIVAVCGRAGIETQYQLDVFTTDVAKNHAVDQERDRVVLQMVNQDHRLYLKNAIDLVVSSVGMVVLLPLFLLIAALIKLTSRGPVFFVQQRFGLGKRTFGMIKFRSMVEDAEARQGDVEHLNEVNGPTFKIKSDPRVTKFGALLRRTSLDELPQLINVLKGDMSLVGPRPLPTRDVERFSEAWLMRRFSVKPGITGLWQVSGRSNTDFDSAIRMDLRYIDRWSMIMDVKILLMTFSAVVKGRGAY